LIWIKMPAAKLQARLGQALSRADRMRGLPGRSHGNSASGAVSPAGEVKTEGRIGSV